jgi:membrane protease YdiL (CAAX protease family)
MNIKMINMVELISQYTLKQWSIIDSEYLEPDKRDNGKVLSAIVLVTVLLIIKRYYGNARTFDALFGVTTGNWPFPDIWVHIYVTFTSVLLFFLIPWLFISFFLHERLYDHGVRLKGVARYKRIYLSMLLIVLPLVVIASQSAEFTSKYPIYPQAGNSWEQFLIWELAYGIYFFALEFIFRGFMIFALARYLGAYAIFVMVIPYVMIHFGKPLAETFGSIIAGVALGTLALRTRSIFGGVLIHIIVAWSMDILAIIYK